MVSKWCRIRQPLHRIHPSQLVQEVVRHVSHILFMGPELVNCAHLPASSITHVSFLGGGGWSRGTITSYKFEQSSFAGLSRHTSWVTVLTGWNAAQMGRIFSQTISKDGKAIKDAPTHHWVCAWRLPAGCSNALTAFQVSTNDRAEPKVQKETLG